MQSITKKKALYHLNIKQLKALQPDIIVTQSLCDVCAVSVNEINEAIHYLPTHPKVVNLEPMCLQDMFETLHMLGEATDSQGVAVETVNNLNKRIEHIRFNTKKFIKKKQYPKVVFLEWVDPLFSAGHWTPELIDIAGGISCLCQKQQPSTTIAWDKITILDPDVIFIACCGFSMRRAINELPILKAKEGWNNLSCVKNNRVYFADGNAYFNRPGPRLVDSLEIIAHALHPDIHKLSPSLPPAINISRQ